MSPEASSPDALPNTLPDNRPSALLLIPVYNHARTLRAVVEAALGEGWEVLVVDDGSTDGALEAVSDLPIAIHRLPFNQGKGAALLTGAALARSRGFEAVITVDADGQHDPRDARSLLDSARPAWPAIVLGARPMDGEHVPASSRFGMAFSNFWVRLECGQNLPDTQSGFRLYPTEFLAGGRFLTRRYTFEIEALVRGAWAGLPILSVPIRVHYPPGAQRVTHFRKFRDNARLSCLHTWLVTRSLLPWPHRRRFHRDAKPAASLLHPGRFLRQLSREHTSPRELAAAVGVGVALGALPIIPFGVAAILYVCHRLRLNKLAGAGASNLCIAPFVPFLCIEVGHLLLHGRWWTDFTSQGLLREIHLRIWEWLLGSLIVGPVLGGACAILTYWVVRRLRRHSRAFE